MTASILRYNASIVTGTLNTVSAASVTGASIMIGSSFLKLENVSAHLILTAATASITITPYWQGSNDDSTYVTLENPGTPLRLPIVTGTANKTVSAAPPTSISGYRYARCMLLVGGATGAAGDLFSIGYNYRQNYA